MKCIWLNFQKKYEYNPIHYHNNDLSFVIWVQIPYDLEKELECPNSKNSNIPLNSIFSFFYTDIFGKIKTAQIHVDKSYEGTVVVFSPDLQHMVYPFFTSDQYRISISGNVKK